MNINILQEKGNALFNRKEIIAEVISEIAPKRIDIRKALAEKTKSEEEAIIIKKITGKFGSKNFNIKASIYPSREDLEKVEPKIERKNPTPKTPEPVVEETKSEEAPAESTE